MPVEHMKAVDEQLAVRYLLQEMTAGEAEEFEQHFFECEECASAVEEGQILLANGKQVAREAPQTAAERTPDKHRLRLGESLLLWWSRPAGFIPVAASLLLGAFVLYQNAVIIPALRHTSDAARVIPAFQLIGASRGDASTVTIPRGASSFTLSADVPPDVQFPQYSCELISDGRTVFQLKAQSPAGGQPITILVQTHDLKAGRFDLTIFGVGADGQKREKVSVFPFELRFHS